MAGVASCRWGFGRPVQSWSLGSSVVATASSWSSVRSSMVEMVARIPLVRNLTDPGHIADSSPIPADGQSVSVGAVTKVADGAIWTYRRPGPHLHPVNGPAGSVGSDAGALPMAAVISSSLRSAQTSMSAVLVAPVSVLVPLPLLSLPLLPPQDVRTSRATQAVAILSLMKGPFAALCPSTLRLGRLRNPRRIHTSNRQPGIRVSVSWCGERGNRGEGRSVLCLPGGHFYPRQHTGGLA